MEQHDVPTITGTPRGVRAADFAYLSPELCHARLVTSSDEPSIDQQIEWVAMHLHILEPLLQALRDPQAVLGVLAGAADPDAGRAALAERFGLDEVQAAAVMDAQFSKTTRAEVDAIEDRVQETRTRLEVLRARRLSGA